MTKVLLVICLLGICLSALNAQESRQIFLLPCLEVAKFSTFFVGSCPLYYKNFYNNILSTVAYIKTAENSWSIDQLLKNHLFNGSTKYFRNTYSSRKDFIDTLNGKRLLITFILKFFLFMVFIKVATNFNDHLLLKVKLSNTSK